MIMKFQQDETSIDLSFSPDSYWPESPDHEVLLSRIQSKARREIVRHKTWGPRRSSIEEAIWDMEQADYDFYLFVEDETSDTAFVSHQDGGIAVQFSAGVSEDEASAASKFAYVNPKPAPTMRPDVAMTLLNESHAPFVFAADVDGSAFVLYRRFDGHFGLIEPREQLAPVGDVTSDVIT